MRSCDVLARMLPRRAGISLRFRSRREHEFSLILDAVRIERSFPRSSFHPFVQDSRETRRITRSLFKEIRVGRRGAFRIDHRCVQRATRVQRNRSEIALEAKTHDPSVDPSDWRFGEDFFLLLRKKNGTRGNTSLTPWKKENTPDGWETRHTLEARNFLHRARCTSTKQERRTRRGVTYTYWSEEGCATEAARTPFVTLSPTLTG